MKTKLFIISAAGLFITLFIISCGKKDEPPKTDNQTQQQQTQQQQTQQQQTQQQQTQQQQLQQTQQPQANDDGTVKDADVKKEEKLKKEDDKKKADEKIKEEKRKQDSVSKIDNKTESSDFGAIWAKKCTKCHGKTGTGKVEGVPNLTRAETKKKSTSELIKIITNGVKGKTEDDEDMPSWKGKLTDDEIKQAAEYVKGL